MIELGMVRQSYVLIQCGFVLNISGWLVSSVQFSSSVVLIVMFQVLVCIGLSFWFCSVVDNRLLVEKYSVLFSVQVRLVRLVCLLLILGQNSSISLFSFNVLLVIIWGVMVWLCMRWVSSVFYSVVFENIMVISLLVIVWLVFRKYMKFRQNRYRFWVSIQLSVLLCGMISWCCYSSQLNSSMVVRLKW